MMRLGFVVNPFAGMGGKVALKGTDGGVKEAIRRGARKEAPQKAIEFLRNISIPVEIYTASGEMGEDECRAAGKNAIVVYHAGKRTTGMDTTMACMEFLKHDVDVIVFAGGDETARDVYRAVGRKKPIIGIPAGVKMYSAIFALTPYKAAEALRENTITDAEILDIDENAFRNDRLEIKLYGVALTKASDVIQPGKGISQGNGKEEIAEWIVENMEDEIGYIIGAGTTTWEIKKRMHGEATLLGVDVFKNGEIVIKDADEKSILEFLNEENAKIIVSPIGKQGFIFGRGNQQISSEVIKRVGKNNIIIVATPLKLQGIEALHVDTGDKRIDEMLSGWIRVITGYGYTRLVKII